MFLRGVGEDFADLLAAGVSTSLCVCVCVFFLFLHVSQINEFVSHTCILCFCCCVGRYRTDLADVVVVRYQRLLLTSHDTPFNV